MKRRFPTPVLAFVLASIAPAAAQGETLEAASPSPSIFRLGISAVGPADEPLTSIFLAPAAGGSPGGARMERGAGFETVSTSAGSLTVWAASGEWTLKDPTGRVLAASARAVSADAGGGGNPPKISVALRSPGTEAPKFYGSGNDVPSLLHTVGKSGVGNGWAIVPHFWCSAGYAVLAVGADDAAPARWSYDPDTQEATWTFNGSRADLYFMPAEDLKAAAERYGELSGRAPVPPRWAFGYLQSRWGWKDQAYIDDALRQFRGRKLPVDAFIFDFEWYTPTPDYKVPPAGLPDFPDFGWNSALFPDPEGQIAAFHTDGLRFVGIRKPRLGDDRNLALMRERGWVLPHPHGEGNAKAELYHSRDIDFRNPDLRRWYTDHLTPMLADGIDGWWNDEGEATFVNYYYWNEAERDANARVHPDRRFWSINRAFQPGLQRLGAAAWTGDIDSTWAVLAATPASLLNWSLAGMPYGACDIGGFKHEDTPELLARWMEAGVFFPVMRSHSSRLITPRFPWLYGPEAESAIRKALDLRYRLLPYYYSLAHEQEETGEPIMRPVLMEFPRDPRATDLTSQWFIGDSLMAAPLLRQGGHRGVYLPDDTWHRFETADTLPGGRSLDVSAALDEIPMYVRAGSILPLGPVIQTTAEAPGGPLDLEIYPGKDASFTLVEDDGETTAYLDGRMRKTIFSWDDGRRSLSWKSEGPYSGKDLFTSAQVTVYAPGGIVRTAISLEASGEWTAGSNAGL